MAEDAIPMQILAAQAQAKANQLSDRDSGRMEAEDNDAGRFDFDYDTIDLGF
jgi:hypothetical protein